MYDVVEATSQRKQPSTQPMYAKEPLERMDSGLY